MNKRCHNPYVIFQFASNDMDILSFVTFRRTFRKAVKVTKEKSEETGGLYAAIQERQFRLMYPEWRGGRRIVAGS